MFSPENYHIIFLIMVLALTIFYVHAIRHIGAESLLRRKGASLYVNLIITLIFTLFLGLRPISGLFIDTMTYYQIYSDIQQGVPTSAFVEQDKLFGYLMVLSASIGLSANVFFLIIEALYLFPVLWACHRLSKNSTDLLMLFVVGAFSFYSYGVNGIRNGMALSFVMLGMTFIQGGAKDKLIFLFLSVISVMCHFSCILPVICAIAASSIKKPIVFFYFWIFSIVVSLFIGEPISNFFASLGFDDRLSYINAEVNDELFSRAGFRWDFLLYSIVPIVLGWYIIYNKHIINRTYSLILGTYMLANAFWIMIIRAEYSNRFAYLSWFLYPIVLAYPLVKFPIWRHRQGQNVALIMIAHFAFTFGMFLIDK